jgi:hypothetical protein
MIVSPYYLGSETDRIARPLPFAYTPLARWKLRSLLGATF